MTAIAKLLSITLPSDYWDELYAYAKDNKLSFDTAASDILLHAINETMAINKEINSLMEQANDAA